MILDTSFIIDLMDNNEQAIAKLNELLARNEPQLVASPSIFELWSGITQSNKPDKEKTKVLAVLACQAILSLDQHSAEMAGEIDGRLVKEGQIIDPEDCMIAGIAKKNNETILTRNVKHFSKIKGIKIETY